MKYLFLYTEPADYTMKCMKRHLQLNANDEIHLVHYPMNPEAPFDFEQTAGIKMYNKAELGYEGLFDLIGNIQPNVIVCSGWGDKQYIKLVRVYQGKFRFAICFDNIWFGTLKQRLLLPIARFLIQPLFQYCWVPGESQKQFALKMGFANDQIKTGFYTTDTSLFNRMGKAKENQAKKDRKKRFVCMARYIPEKSYSLLWNTFIQLYDEGYQDWELWCAGTGRDFDKRTEHPAIKHLGFIQPSQIESVIEATDVFVLASSFEPWGMVVQEFAAAGFPLILSHVVGCAPAMLEEGVNGFSFKANDSADLKGAMLKMMSKSENDLKNMGLRSAELATATDAVQWSKTLSELAAV